MSAPTSAMTKQNKPEILINGQAMDFELESEETLADLWHGLEKWWEAGQSHPESAWLETHSGEKRAIPVERLSGKPGEKSDAVARETESVAAADTPLDQIQSIHLVLAHRSQAIVSALAELDQYIDRVGSRFFDGGQEIDLVELAHFQEGLAWAADVLNLLSRKTAVSEALEKATQNLEILRKWTESVNTKLNQEKDPGQAVYAFDDKSEDIDVLETLRAFKSAVMVELELQKQEMARQNHAAFIREFAESNPDLLNELTAISTAFAEGQDLEALARLRDFAEQMQFYLLALRSAQAENPEFFRELEESASEEKSGEGTYSQIFEELVSHLKEIAAVMEDQDIISLGDLLEYELAETLTKLNPWLRRISAGLK